ncbi:MAG TPA: hypothetical protein VHI10_12980, partial [Mycobacterium sp.]|nr:hypothetical protein [Mycobacterium sp.]
MSWPARIAIGVAVLAALAVGRTIDTALPIDHTDERPFVHAGGIGDRVHLVYADITVNGVRTAKALGTGQEKVGTPGRWLIVDVTVVAWGRPLSKPGISLQDTRGRTFLSDSRSGFSWVSAPTGVPWRMQIPFEVPADALPGATLVLSRNAIDDRRDDVARIDLGLEP